MGKIHFASEVCIKSEQIKVNNWTFCCVGALTLAPMACVQGLQTSM